MKRLWKKGRDGLEVELRANRPEPRHELIESITEHVRAEAPRRRARPLQLAYAGALTTMMLVALAAAGGVGSTASAISSVSAKLASVISPNSSPTVVTTSPAQAQYTHGCGDYTINHPACGIQIGDASTKEGNSGTKIMSFRVSLSDRPLSPVTVNYTTAPGTATSGGDYQPVSGTLTFAIGQSTATILVPIVGDTTIELNETFTVTLTSPSGNAIIVDGTGTGTIVNDDK